MKNQSEGGFTFWLVITTLWMILGIPAVMIAGNESIFLAILAIVVWVYVFLQLASKTRP